MTIYNKLVRDYIPTIIKETGQQPRYSILTDTSYKAALQDKLREEIEEVIHANTSSDKLEELADVLELLHAIAKQEGFSMKEVDTIRQNKRDFRGGFDKKIYLHEVTV
ncbi:nucleoside triphosphate pyrophosphohydrolase [Paraliobacillus sp. JSM ZJ581]|uniref:nucleoside triphosphate pyrophosphohydrolase n=1 Tax=Paraliobacillus sp. JSM ZJ581 TaxID=3342118 RepID=UPI0035A81B43